MDPHYNEHGPGEGGYPYGHDRPPAPPEPPVTPPPEDKPYEAPQQPAEKPYYMDEGYPGFYDERPSSFTSAYQDHNSGDKEAKERADNGYGGPEVQFQTQDALGLHTTLLRFAQVSASLLLDAIKRSITGAKTKKELENYEKLYQKVLRKPEDYNVFHIDGDAISADMFTKALKENFGVKADMFESMEGMICIKAKDRDKFLAAVDEIAKNPEKYLKSTDSERSSDDERDEGDERGPERTSRGRGDVPEEPDNDDYDIGDWFKNDNADGINFPGDETQGFDDDKKRHVGTREDNRKSISGHHGVSSGDQERTEPGNPFAGGSSRAEAADETQDFTRGDLTSGNVGGGGGLADSGLTASSGNDSGPVIPGGASYQNGDTEHKSVGTMDANRKALGGQSQIKGAPSSSISDDSGQYNFGGGQRNFTSNSRTQVVSVSDVAIKSNKNYHDDRLRNLALNTELIGVAAMSVGATMIASAGKDDPAIQQLHSGFRAFQTVRDVTNLTALGARGSARAAELKVRSIENKFDRETFNSIKNYAKGGPGSNTTTRLVNNLKREGVIKTGMGGSWHIDKKRMFNDVLGPGATKEQKKLLSNLLKNEETRRMQLKNHKQSVRNLKGKVIARFENQDDSSRAMGKTVRYMNKARKGLVTGVKWSGNKITGLVNKVYSEPVVTPYEERFRKRQAAANSGFHGSAATDAANGLTGGGKLKGGDSLNKGTGRPNRRKIGKGNSSSNNRGKIRLRRNMENGGVRNGVRRNRITPLSVARSAVGLRNTVHHKIGQVVDKVTAPLNPVKKAVRKVSDAVVRVTSPLRAIWDFPTMIIHKVVMLFAKLVGGYFISMIVLAVMISTISSGFTIIAMFVSDTLTELTTPSSAESIAGRVYTELRYTEILWASSIRSAGTNKQPLLVSDLQYTDQDFNLYEYLNSDAGVADYLGAFAVSDESLLKDSYTNEEFYSTFYNDKGNVKNGISIGVQGPQPFEGAGLNEYKLIKSIDAGNQLEIVGKPLDGWTSNAKEVIAMSAVFYQQVLEGIQESFNLNADNSSDEDGENQGWTAKIVSSSINAWIGAKKLWHGLGSLFDKCDIPLLGDVTGASDWSYSGILRSYAYPLFVNARYCNYYLSTYIHPTKWTNPGVESKKADTEATDTSSGTRRDGSRYDENQEKKEKNEGDEALLAGVSSEIITHSAVGNSTSGGSGKVDAGNRVSTNYYSDLGDSTYQGFETCEDAVVNYDSSYLKEGTNVISGSSWYTSDFNIDHPDSVHTTDQQKKQSQSAAYNGYGCQLRYTFSQKWQGSFGTNKDGELANEEESGINTLHYGEADLDWNEPNEGDTDGEVADEENNGVKWHKTGQDVSSDVAPYWDGDDIAQEYNKDSCLVFPTEMTDQAWACWKIQDGQESYYGYPTHDLDNKKWKADYAKDAFKNFEEAGYRLDHIDANGESGISYEEGFIVWYYYPVYEVQEWTDENGEVHTRRIDVSDEAGVTFIGIKVQHDCEGKHEGVYCGGHAQLRTQGVVLGFSYDQMSDVSTTTASADDTTPTSSFMPKVLEPEIDENGGYTGNADPVDKTKYGNTKDIRGKAIDVFDPTSDKFSSDNLNLAENDSLRDKLISGVKSKLAYFAGFQTGYVTGLFFGEGLIGGVIGGITTENAYNDAQATGIVTDDAEYVKQAKDIFDIDYLIKRPSDTYPQCKRAFFGDGILGDLTSNLFNTTGNADTNWDGWTVTNMATAVSLALQDFEDMYEVVDSQTIVGGQDEVNALNTDTSGNIMNQLGWDEMANNLDLASEHSLSQRSKGAAEKYANGEIVSGNGGRAETIDNIDEEVEYIYRLRHVKYAMSLVGKVGYNQTMHTFLWTNLSGHQTDCSGFVSNVWRDALGLKEASGAYSTYALYQLAVDNGAWHSLSGTSIEDSAIEPGDIILKDSSGAETDAAHALIYVGMLDETKMVISKEGDLYTEEDQKNGLGPAGGYKDRELNTYQSVGKGSVRPYTIDCSTMTITTEAFANNKPNSMLLDSAIDRSALDTSYENREPSTYWENYSPELGLETNGEIKGKIKVRSGNTRFAVRPYLEGSISGDIGYIDMYALGQALGYYHVDASTHTLTCDTGLMANDFANMQRSDDGKLYPNGKNLDYQTADENSFWTMMTANEANLDARKTVVLKQDEGDESEAPKSDDAIETPPMDNGGDSGNDDDDEPEVDGRFVWPVTETTQSSGYGIRYHPIKHEYKLHAGTDIPVGTGTKVHASAGGTVTIVGWDPDGYGNWIEIDHGNGIKTRYAHLSSTNVKVGQKVEQWDVIARSGNTGRSTGPHLHFEYRVNGNPLDPRKYVSM